MMVRGYVQNPRPKDMIYAPIDLAVAIADGLVKKGHSVDLYGPLGSELKHANVVTRNLRPLVRDKDEFSELLDDTAMMSHYVPALWDQYLASEMFRRARAGVYDLLHFHHPEIALPLIQGYRDVPVVYTQHDPVYSWYKELYELYSTPNQHFISISNNQRRDAPDLPYLETVYNGVNIDQYPFSSDTDDYLLAAGRIVPEKGFKEAVQVAKMANKRLLIIGPVYKDNQGYFDQYIKPHLGDQILYLGYVEREQMWRYYQKAQAFLTPIQWEEPFGLTSIEAMACGTPVISLKRGAAPEIIVDGKTGFLVDSIGEMNKAIDMIGDISRSDCREHVKENFSIDLMVANYEKAFKKVLRLDRERRRPDLKTYLKRLLHKD
jgi:glycosyltransferase involved in cell wall biosynthesis